MEAHNKNNHEEVKAENIAFRPEYIKFPRCPLHRTDASLVPKNDEGWTKYSNRILKCNRCISSQQLDSSEFGLLDEVLAEYSYELSRISTKQSQNHFLGTLDSWLKQLAILQNSIKELTESIQGYIKIHQGGELTQKLRSYLDACITKEIPDYNDFAKNLKTLKQLFSFSKYNVKIIHDPTVFAKKVDTQDLKMHQMVKDMQSRIAKFRDGMQKVESNVKDQAIDVEDSIEDKPENIVAQLFESNTKTFKYITVDGVKSNNYTQKQVAIEHIANFPYYHFAPMTRKGTIYLIGGGDVTQLDTCWELDLKHNVMIPKQRMKNKRGYFSGVVVQDKYIQVVCGHTASGNNKLCERQDIAANTWQNIAEHPVEAYSTACCNFDDRCIYSIGGLVNDGSNDIYVQEINKNTWKQADVDSGVGREITPDQYKSAFQINERQIQLFGGHESPGESRLLEVDENNNGKIKVKESNKFNLGDKQIHQNYLSNVVYQNKLQCSYYSKSWSCKTSCFDSQRWRVLQ